ncbi:hypothetical protein ACFXDH_47895 [Streptomyces sp. NPDC059467]|uniref:hypothetical protein n=1 Tax=Streptomyces sp. NPDC059467 TaxID=3346844 RepID=UPI0036AFEA57
MGEQIRDPVDFHYRPFLAPGSMHGFQPVEFDISQLQCETPVFGCQETGLKTDTHTTQPVRADRQAAAPPTGCPPAADQQAAHHPGGPRFPGRAPPPTPQAEAAAAASDRLAGDGPEVAP